MDIIWIVTKYASHNVEMEFLHKMKNVKFRMKIVYIVFTKSL